MKSAGRIVAALLALTSLVSAARAEMVGFAYAWQFGSDPYNYHVSGAGVSSVSTAISAVNKTIDVDYGIGVATLALPTASSASTELGSLVPGTGAIMPFAIYSATGITDGTGDELFFFSVQMPVELTFTDVGSGDSVTITGFAELAGSVGDDIASLAGNADFADSSFMLGGKQYFINKVTPEWTPFPGSGGEPLTFELEVFAASDLPDDPGEVPETVPEPSTLMLGGGMLSLWGLSAVRRRRRENRETN